MGTFCLVLERLGTITLVGRGFETRLRLRKLFWEFDSAVVDRVRYIHISELEFFRFFVWLFLLMRYFGLLSAEVTKPATIRN